DAAVALVGEGAEALRDGLDEALAEVRRLLPRSVVERGEEELPGAVVALELALVLPRLIEGALLVGEAFLGDVAADALEGALGLLELVLEIAQRPLGLGEPGARLGEVGLGRGLRGRRRELRERGLGLLHGRLGRGAIDLGRGAPALLELAL